MVTPSLTLFSRRLEAVYDGISVHFKNRKLLPFFYLSLALICGVSAHHQSEELGMTEWKKHHPPSTHLWKAELTHLGWTYIGAEKKQRELYRSFPYKGEAIGEVFVSQSWKCLAITTSTDSGGIPLYFCHDAFFDSHLKPDWKRLGFGWDAWDDVKLLGKPLKKLKIITPTWDPREIRY